MKVARKVDEKYIDWSTFKYVVYDIPTHRGTYSERYNELGNCLPICEINLLILVA